MSEEAKLVCQTCGMEFVPAHPSWRKHATRAECITALRVDRGIVVAALSGQRSQNESLRAALDQERADNERLRAFARDVLQNANDASPYLRQFLLGLLAEQGVTDDYGNPTALLSGRGEGGNDA